MTCYFKGKQLKDENCEEIQLHTTKYLEFFQQIKNTLEQEYFKNLEVCFNQKVKNQHIFD